jgi:hypothetical protein
MRTALCLALACCLTIGTAFAQSPQPAAGAADSRQLSQPEDGPPPPSRVREFKIPAGTPLEIEAAYTVNSQYVRPEEMISFRLLVPVRIDGVTVIEKYSLVTGRIVQAKRGGHWGKAGKLSWVMQDVVAVDLTRVPLQADRDTPTAANRMTGTSHGGQVAAQIAIAAPLMLFAAPLALTAGFKRGEDAVLPEGKRFVVFVKADTLVKSSAAPADNPRPEP